MADLSKVPDRIYLQDMFDEISWCEDRIEDDDREFIAIEKYNELKDKLERISKLDNGSISDACPECNERGGQWVCEKCGTKN